AGAWKRWLKDHPFRALAADKALEPTTRVFGVSASPQESQRSVQPVTSTRTLPNGLRLAISSNPSAHVFAAHVLIAGRPDAEGSVSSGLADLVQRVLARRGPDFASRLDAIGATVKTTDDPALPFDDYYDLPEYGYVRLECPDG